MCKTGYIFGTEKHLMAFEKLADERRRVFREAPETPIAKKPNENRLSELLHPKTQQLVITEKRQDAEHIFIYTLKPKDPAKKPAFFQAGQYLSVKLNINGYPVTRPYTICSSPEDALSGFYKLAIQKVQDGFASEFIHNNWDVGSEVETSGPEGRFVYNRLRDASTILGIAGGCGVTPFSSMARDIASGRQNYQLVLLYGCRKEENILFRDEWEEIEKMSQDKVRLVYVLSEEEKSGFENGFVTAELIKKYGTAPFSVFICGPQAMYNFVSEELKSMNLKRKSVRRELFGQISNIFDLPDYPREKGNKVHKLSLKRHQEVLEMPASSHESLLVAIERGKVPMISNCRSGECGMCRVRLLSGEIYASQMTHGLRHADQANDIIHSCASYPLSDVEVELL